MATNNGFPGATRKISAAITTRQKKIKNIHEKENFLHITNNNHFFNIKVVLSQLTLLIFERQITITKIIKNNPCLPCMLALQSSILLTITREPYMPEKYYARLTTWAGIIASFVALVLIVTKLIAWLASGASSMLASLTDSLMDLGASLVNLMALRYAVMPADDDHRFGHWKAESLAGLVQSAFVAGSAFFLIIHGLSQIIKPDALRHVNFAIWVSLFSVIITLALVGFQTYVVRKTGSLVIQADMLHYRSDLLMNIGVLLAISLTHQGFYWIDAIFATLVGFYLLKGSYTIGSHAVQSLLDRELPENVKQEVVDLCCSIEGIYGLHDLRTRQAGPVRFIQFHVELEDQLPLIKAHEIVECAERKLHDHFPQADIIIHLDPLSVVTSKVAYRCTKRNDKAVVE